MRRALCVVALLSIVVAAARAQQPLPRRSVVHLWTRTELTPADVDVAELYDGFSFITLAWLEALGFCGHGEGGPFIEGGERIALGVILAALVR